MSNRLSRESSQDILVEDLDRLSTTSAMSESSVSHRLNDVQDVQDIARLQEESLKHSTPLKQRSDTISPLSEHSLSSPVEEGGGYQSEVTMLNAAKMQISTHAILKLADLTLLLDIGGIIILCCRSPVVLSLEW